MKQILIKRISAENFKCFGKRVSFDFKDGINIAKGRNGKGKTTLNEIVEWVLFNISGEIRPHDADGKQIDFVDIVGEVTFEVDGREIVIEKTQKQEYVKDKFKGNRNFYKVNSIPKLEKEYNQYISENFLPKEQFLFFTRIEEFWKKSANDRRNILIKYVSDMTDEDVIATNPAKFEPLRACLQDGDVKQLIKRCNDTIKLFEKQKEEIPARIDEKRKEYVQIDLAELELAKNSIKDKVSEIDAKLNNINKQYADYQSASDGLLEIKFAMSDLERKAYEELRTKKEELNENICSIEFEARDIQKKIDDAENEIKLKNGVVDTCNKGIEQQAKLWSIAKNRVFDENSLICSYCGQEYPLEKQQVLKDEFESHKADELKLITDKGNELRKTIDSENAKISSLKKDVEMKSDELEEVLAQVGKIKAELSSLPTEIDMSGSEEYSALAKQLAEKESALSKFDSASDARQAYEDEKSDLLSQLEEINIKVGSAQENAKIDERIAELEASHRGLEQKIADEERTLYLLKQFDTAKSELLSKEVNKHFSMVKWKLFEKQINGETKDVCESTVNGIPYSKGLNDSDCLLANIDILTAFQKFNDVQITIFLDRAESVNNDRLPKTDNQIIYLKVSEDERLVVE